MNRFLSISIAALAAGAVLCPLDAQADNALTTLSGAPASAMSPDGKYIVGTKTGFSPDWSFMTHSSFL